MDPGSEPKCAHTNTHTPTKMDFIQPKPQHRQTPATPQSGLSSLGGQRWFHSRMLPTVLRLRCTTPCQIARLQFATHTGSVHPLFGKAIEMGGGLQEKPTLSDFFRCCSTVSLQSSFLLIGVQMSQSLVPCYVNAVTFESHRFNTHRTQWLLIHCKQIVCIMILTYLVRPFL